MFDYQKTWRDVDDDDNDDDDGEDDDKNGNDDGSRGGADDEKEVNLPGCEAADSVVWEWGDSLCRTEIGINPINEVDNEVWGYRSSS